MDNLTMVAGNTTALLMNVTGEAAAEGHSWIGALLANPAVLIALISVVGVAALLLFMLHSVMPITPFLYANARIQAKKKITPKKWAELAQAGSVENVIRGLQDTEYGVYIEHHSLKGIHRAVEKGALLAGEDIMKMTPKSAQKLVGSYLMFAEARMLKAFFRAKFAGKDLEESLIIEGGNLTHTRIKHLKEAKTVADMAVVMAETPYAALFAANPGSVEAFDAALESTVLTYFLKEAQKTKIYEAKLMRDIVAMRVDVLNLLSLIKCMIREVPREKRAEALIPNDTALGGRTAALAATEDIRSLIAACKGTIYTEALQSAMRLFEKDGSYFHFDRELYAAYVRRVADLEIAHSIGPFPLFAKLIRIDNERRNLLIISKGIDAKMKAEEIMEMIII